MIGLGSIDHVHINENENATAAGVAEYDDLKHYDKGTKPYFLRCITIPRK